MKKAILIDVQAQTITETQIGHYSDIYAKIGNGCHTFACPVEFDNGDSLYIDDEGLYHDPKGCFVMKGWAVPVVGNAIILGSDEEGESVDCQSTIEAIQSQVKFFNKGVAKAWAEKALSTPPQIIVY